MVTRQVWRFLPHCGRRRLRKPAVLTRLIKDSFETHILLDQPEASYKQDDAIRKAVDRRKIFLNGSPEMGYVDCKNRGN
jgi:hypothetical protein